MLLLKIFFLTFCKSFRNYFRGSIKRFFLKPLSQTQSNLKSFIKCLNIILVVFFILVHFGLCTLKMFILISILSILIDFDHFIFKMFILVLQLPKNDYFDPLKIKINGPKLLFFKNIMAKINQSHIKIKMNKMN